MDRPVTYRPLGLVILFITLTCVAGCDSKKTAATDHTPAPPSSNAAPKVQPPQARQPAPPAAAPGISPRPIPKFSAEDVAAGKALAPLYCQSCHMLPQPEWLDKPTWYHSAMPNMSTLLGRYAREIPEQSVDYIPQDWFEPGEGGERIRQAKAFPTQPVVTAEQWRQLVAYYVSEAPPTPLLIEQPFSFPEITFPFKIHKFPVDPDFPPAVTCLKILSGGNQIAVGESQSNSLRIYDKTGRALTQTRFNGPPVQINEFSENTFVVTDMGSFIANDTYRGKLMLVERDPQSQQLATRPLLEGLPRPVHATIADFNGDGQSDYLVSGFGRWTGNLSWYDTASLTPHTLDNMPGYLNCYVADMDGDGLPDIATLRSHGDEAIVIYHNKGKGAFEKQVVARFPPCYVCNYMELVDFNKDGFPDILMTNGDNGDYPSVLKKYHGIRLFINQKDGSFKQEQFFPMYGAVKAKAVDYDLDGDLDIVAISFFPDFNADLKASFVLLENKGAKGFIAHSFKDADAGRWLAMDVADIDNDGDPDIVLGANNISSDVPPALIDRWRANPQSVIWLENLTK